MYRNHYKFAEQHFYALFIFTLDYRSTRDELFQGPSNFLQIVWYFESNLFYLFLWFFFVWKGYHHKLWFSFYLESDNQEDCNSGKLGGLSLCLANLLGSFSIKKSWTKFERCDGALSWMKIQSFLFITLALSSGSSFCKCFLYVLEFTFNTLSFTKKSYVAPFHVTQAKTITVLGCLSVWW